MSEHNTENPVSCAEAMAALGCSSYVLSALRNHLGIRGRTFMLSPVRDFLLKNPSWTTTEVYKTGKRKMSIGIEQIDGLWVVSFAGTKLDGRNLEKTIANAVPLVKEAFQRAA